MVLFVNRSVLCRLHSLLPQRVLCKLVTQFLKKPSCYWPVHGIQPMSHVFHSWLLALAIAASTGCQAPDSEPDAVGPSAAAAIDPAVAVSEQRTESLVELLREMRDTDANLAWPLPNTFWAEVRRRHPGMDPSSDMTLDGWRRPLLYVRGGDMRTYRLYSAGPNGRDEYGTGDDVALRQGETVVE